LNKVSESEVPVEPDFFSKGNIDVDNICGSCLSFDAIWLKFILKWLHRDLSPVIVFKHEREDNGESRYLA